MKMWVLYPSVIIKKHISCIMSKYFIDIDIFFVITFFSVIGINRITVQIII